MRLWLNVSVNSADYIAAGFRSKASTIFGRVRKKMSRRQTPTLMRPPMIAPTIIIECMNVGARPGVSGIAGITIVTMVKIEITNPRLVMVMRE